MTFAKPGCGRRPWCRHAGHRWCGAPRRCPPPRHRRRSSAGATWSRPSPPAAIATPRKARTGRCRARRWPAIGWSRTSRPSAPSPPNITPDRATGIGGWTDAQIARAIREGIRPDGSLIGPPMPIGLYRGLADDDLAAMVAYLRSVPAVSNAAEKSTYRIPLPPAYGPPVGQVAAPPRTDMVAYGGYLAGPVAHCIECHTPMLEGGRRDATKLGAGGQAFAGPWGSAVAANITSSQPAGSAPGAMRRSSGRSAPASPATAARLHPPMAFAQYRDIAAPTWRADRLPAQPPAGRALKAGKVGEGKDLLPRPPFPFGSRHSPRRECQTHKNRRGPGRISPQPCFSRSRVAPRQGGDGGERHQLRPDPPFLPGAEAQHGGDAGRRQHRRRHRRAGRPRRGHAPAAAPAPRPAARRAGRAPARAAARRYADAAAAVRRRQPQRRRGAGEVEALAARRSGIRWSGTSRLASIPQPTTGRSAIRSVTKSQISRRCAAEGAMRSAGTPRASTGPSTAAWPGSPGPGPAPSSRGVQRGASSAAPPARPPGDHRQLRRLARQQHQHHRARRQDQPAQPAREAGGGDQRQPQPHGGGGGLEAEGEGDRHLLQPAHRGADGMAGHRVQRREGQAGDQPDGRGQQQPTLGRRILGRHGPGGAGAERHEAADLQRGAERPQRLRRPERGDRRPAEQRQRHPGGGAPRPGPGAVPPAVRHDRQQQGDGGDRRDGLRLQHAGDRRDGQRDRERQARRGEGGGAFHGAASGSGKGGPPRHVMPRLGPGGARHARQGAGWPGQARP